MRPKPLTDKDFVQAMPFAELFPDQHRAWKRRIRPPLAQPKVHVGFRLDADAVAGIKATGRRYNVQIEKVLREALYKAKL